METLAISQLTIMADAGGSSYLAQAAIPIERTKI
jgi:hypothetical protein